MYQSFWEIAFTTAIPFWFFIFSQNPQKIYHFSALLQKNFLLFFYQTIVFFEKYGKMAETALTLGSQMCVRSHLTSGRRLSLLLPH